MVTWTRWCVAALAAAGLPLFGCATSYETHGAGGGGGEGGDVASSAATGPKPACLMDCSTLEAPPCHEGACNEETHECEVVPSPKGSPCEIGRAHV